MYYLISLLEVKMTDINLHRIFCHLTGDENFLSKVIEVDKVDIKQKKLKKKGLNMLMIDMIQEYETLSPYQIQSYSCLPHKVKMYLTPEHNRLGIKNVIDKDMNIINISFLNSFNMLLRPELYNASIEEHIKNVGLLESFICDIIHHGYHIDKVKNTRKNQTLNKELVKKLREGVITHDLIQYIVDIFEVNLLVFDLTKMEICLYWTKGIKYPYFNPFKEIYCMSYVQCNYEPIMTKNGFITHDQKIKIYTQILTNNKEIKCMPEIILNTYSLSYINSWDIDFESYLKIIETYFNKPSKSIEQGIKELESINKQK